jgi:hypothetical protein
MPNNALSIQNVTWLMTLKNKPELMVVTRALAIKSRTRIKTDSLYFFSLAFFLCFYKEKFVSVRKACAAAIETL